MKSLPLLIGCALLAACATDDRPPLSIDGLRVLAPMPATDVSVGYMTIENHEDRPLVLKSVSSPQFERVEIHVTILDGDIARMQRMEQLEIGAASSVELKPGGTHLMLIGPVADVTAGTRISLQFDFSDRGLLIVETTIVGRQPADAALQP